MKLKEALDLFLLVDRAPATRDTYRQFLTRFVNDIGPGRPLDLVTPEDLDAFVLDMRERREKFADHPTRPTVKGPLSSVTIYKNVKMIKAFFNWCVGRDLLELSPGRYLKNRRPKRPFGVTKAISDSDLELVLAAARFKPREWAIVQLLAVSGCRAGELAELRIPDLDLSAHRAYVTGKGDKRRKLYFTEPVSKAIQTWLDVRPECDHDHVFVAAYHPDPLTAPAVSQITRRLCKVASVKPTRGAHSFRHRVGVKLARAGTPVRVIQEILGHENSRETVQYYQTVEDSDVNAALQWL